jgi:hypothetical protein
MIPARQMQGTTPSRLKSSDNRCQLVPSRMNRLDWNLYATAAGKDEPACGS